MMRVNLKAMEYSIEHTPGWSQLKAAKYKRSKRSPDKYFAVSWWLKEALKRWEDIERFDSRLVTRKTSVLDIGAGFGLFAMVGKMGTGSKLIEMADAPDPLFDAVTSLLKMPKHNITVNAFTPLQVPNNRRRYDLITSYRMVFDETWGEDEWRFFLRDLHSSLLKKGGSIVLGFNNGRDQRFKQWASDLGAQVLSKRDLIIPFEMSGSC